jgi:hypothetical protein
MSGSSWWIRTHPSQRNRRMMSFRLSLVSLMHVLGRLPMHSSAPLQQGHMLFSWLTTKKPCGGFSTSSYSDKITIDVFFLTLPVRLLLTSAYQTGASSFHIHAVIISGKSWTGKLIGCWAKKRGGNSIICNPYRSRTHNVGAAYHAAQLLLKNLWIFEKS